MKTKLSFYQLFFAQVLDRKFESLPTPQEMTNTAVELPACRNSIQNQNVLLNLEIFLKEEL